MQMIKMDHVILYILDSQDQIPDDAGIIRDYDT